jgi:hypothetical protein
MKKTGLIGLVVCLLWQPPAFATDPLTMMLLGKAVDAIFSSDEKDRPNPNTRNVDEQRFRANTPQNADSFRVDSLPQQHSGYQFQLSWQVPEDGSYSGVLEMRGKTGIFRVTTPRGENIEQDMTAEPTDEKIVVFGSSSRDVKTQLPVNYSPDTFILSKEAGAWTITDVCDEKSRCVGVTVLSANPF